MIIWSVICRLERGDSTLKNHCDFHEARREPAMTRVTEVILGTEEGVDSRRNLTVTREWRVCFKLKLLVKGTVIYEK